MSNPKENPFTGKSVGRGRGILLLQSAESNTESTSMASSRSVGSISSSEGATARLKSPEPSSFTPFGRGAGGSSRASSLSAGEKSNIVGSPSLKFSSGYESDKTVSSGTSSSSGRGLKFSQYIMSQQNIKSPEARLPSIGRGAGIQMSLAKQAVKSEPDKSVVSKSTRTVSEDLSNLTVSSGEEGHIVNKQGSSGVPFSGTCNWVRVAINPDKAVFEYDIKFDSAVDSRSLRFHLVGNIREDLGGIFSFDGNKLWLPIKLQLQVSKFKTKSRHDQKDYELTITFQTRSSMTRNVQLYNVLFGKVMKKLDLVMVGKNYFSPKNSVLVPTHKLEIWPGYVTHAHQTEGGVMLNVDVSHRVLRTSTVYDVMSSYVRLHASNFKEMMIKDVVGSVVLTRYNNKCYRVDDIAFDSNAKSTFTTSQGEEVSYVDYYKRAYNITIKDPNQPLLINKVKKKELKDKDKTSILCLIPELCYMTGLTDEMRSDFRVMKDVSQHTRLTPTARQAAIKKYIHNVNTVPEARKVLSDWGLQLLSDTIPLEGRVLQPETIVFGNRQVAGNPNADWSREACRENVIEAVDLQHELWVIMYTSRDEPRAKRFVETYQKVTTCMGIKIGRPKMCRLQSDSIECYTSNLKSCYHDKIQIVVIIFPTQREDRYSAVKRLACGDLGLPTQCINSKTISQEQKLRSVTQKIALQINCKLGGQLWGVKIPVNGIMTCGVDVYHDPLRKGGSVVGFVASLNQKLTKWFSKPYFQKPGDEVIHGLKISFLEALKNYYEVNQQLPRIIVIYRDGVGDGMLDLTKDHEIPQIASIFLNFDNYSPQFYFVIVQKRINIRIFDSQGSKGLDNPPPGSIIDHTITKRSFYDFLLVSQHVRQGTVSPTHYIVLHDSGDLKPDQIQRLTYKMTYLYYNWPGTVRVPAPCQYAHKLAYLVGENVRKETHQKLNKRLYFL